MSSQKGVFRAASLGPPKDTHPSRSEAVNGPCILSHNHLLSLGQPMKITHYPPLSLSSIHTPSGLCQSPPNSRTLHSLPASLHAQSKGGAVLPRPSETPSLLCTERLQGQNDANPCDSGKVALSLCVQFTSAVRRRPQGRRDAAGQQRAGRHGGCHMSPVTFIT